MNLETVPIAFKKTAEKYGDRVALRKKEYGLWHDISWNELYCQVKYVGSALISMGLEKGKCVSIIGDNCPEWVIADLGIQCVGGVAVGVYSTNAWPQVEYVVEDSNSSFFFVENEEQLDKWLQFRDKVPFLQKVIVWDLEGLRHFTDPMVMTYDDLIDLGRQISEKDPHLFENRMREVTPEDLSVLIYTSGTTGPPKGAMLTHRNVMWMGQAISKDNPVYDTDEMMSFLPLCHIFERLFSVFGLITHGFTINFIENLDTVTDNMREISPTVGYAVPRIWEKYLSAVYIKMSDATWFKKLIFSIALKIGQKRATLRMNFRPVPYYLEALYQLAYLAVFRKLKERLGFDRLRVAYSGAAPISPDVLHFFQSIGVNLIEGYGQTEDTGVTCVSRVGRVKFGTVGPPLQGTEVKLAEDGEILVKAPSVFKGYYKNEEATRETVDEQGWLHSGDVGEIDEEGFLKVTDRIKELIITAGGENISPQALESKLKAIPIINQVVAIGDRRKYVSALLTLDPAKIALAAAEAGSRATDAAQAASCEAFNRHLKQQVDAVNATLPRSWTIKKFVILPGELSIEKGELTPTMKLKRRVIKANYTREIESMYVEE